MACAKSELCIFDTALPQIVIDSSNFEEIYPVNSITALNNPDIEFNITASNVDYLDLNDTLLYIEVKAVDKTGKNLDITGDLIPSNYLFHTLFKDAILTFNNIVIEGGNGLYAQKALIETIINYGTDTKNTSLQSIGYDESDDNRKKWFGKSSTFNMCGSLQLDFFDQPKYLIPGVNVHLKLKRNDASFCLQTTLANASDVRLQITDAKLCIRRVKVEPSVLIGHQLGLNTQNARYPIRKTRLISHAIAQGSTSFYKDLIFGDERLPKFVLIAFQSNAQRNGDFKSDSSGFKHFNVSSLTLSRNTDYHESYSQDFDTNNYMTSYVKSMIRNMGHLDKNLNCGVSFEDFKSSYPFFTFVLAPDFDVFTTQVPKQGNVRLDIKFKEPLEKSGSIYIYGVFDSEIQINKNRTIFI